MASRINDINAEMLGLYYKYVQLENREDNHIVDGIYNAGTKEEPNWIQINEPALTSYGILHLSLDHPDPLIIAKLLAEYHQIQSEVYLDAVKTIEAM